MCKSNMKSITGIFKKHRFMLEAPGIGKVGGSVVMVFCEWHPLGTTFSAYSEARTSHPCSLHPHEKGA